METKGCGSNFLDHTLSLSTGSSCCLCSQPGPPGQGGSVVVNPTIVSAPPSKCLQDLEALHYYLFGLFFSCQF